MDFNSHYKLYQTRVNEALRNFFARYEGSARAFDPVAGEAFERLRDFTLGGGKRLRPILMIFGYKCCGGDDEPAIVAASCALELMQSYLLIHDDIMDRSDVRRGSPTVHRLYQQAYAGKTANPEHFGEAMGILVGDIANHWGAIALSSQNFDAEKTFHALKEYNEIARDVSFGQLLDMVLPIRAGVTYADVAKVHEMKTGRYSTEGPLRLGALLADNNPENLAILTRFAKPLGQAFQIKDDVLGLFGSEETIGKSPKTDVMEGKKTLLILTALEAGDAKQREIILKHLGNEKLTDSDLEAVRQVIQETGARRKSEERMRELLSESKRALQDAPFPPEPKEFLMQLADYIVTREK